MKHITIAIDGPAGSGKSSVAKIVAERLSIEHVDTGAMYRAITFHLLQAGYPDAMSQTIEEVVESTVMQYHSKRVYINSFDVTEEIRSHTVTTHVAHVSTVPSVRRKLITIQREIAKARSIVMEGRDIGSNVLVDADVKIFLTASIGERARRRYQELIANGATVDFNEVARNITERDRIDFTRSTNPLVKATDAFEIGTTSRSLAEVVDEVVAIATGICKSK